MTVNVRSLKLMSTLGRFRYPFDADPFSACLSSRHQCVIANRDTEDDIYFSPISEILISQAWEQIHRANDAPNIYDDLISDLEAIFGIPVL
jgi:hypothetical protein